MTTEKDSSSFDQDYDFDSIDWQDNSTPSSSDAVAKAKPSSPKGFDPSAEDVFPEFGGSAPPATAFGDDDGDTVFEDMPQPGAMSSAPVGFGDADEEFADISSGGVFDDIPGSGPRFDDGSSDIVEDEPVYSPRASADPFEETDDSPNFDEEEEVDEFAEDSEIEAADEDAAEYDDAELENESAATPSRSGLSRMIFPLAAALALGVTGYAGYSFVLPQLLGGDEPVIVAPAPQQVQTPQFPTALPGATEPTDVAQIPQQPSVSQTPSLKVPTTVQPGFDIPDLAASQQADIEPPLAAPVATQPQLAQPPAARSIEDDLAGGSGRGGIDLIRAPEPTPQIASIDPEIVERFERELESVRGDIDSLRREVTALASRPAAAQMPVPQVVDPSPTPVHTAIPASLPQNVIPPFKPALIEGVSLKGLSRGLAWLSTGAGVVEVKEGDTVPGGGEVVRFRSYGGDWIVVTTQGLVTR